MFESEDNRGGQNEWTAPVYMEDIIANLRLR